ncbi:type II toxin-antitoxin system VapC family toxin [Phyllobacterium sp. 22229]|uniref:type II toxin-antitoxin system VapC family toxin n=1 Tax=Phyllobacterium sp. 22229 TaxID=3453895 RepID=UPI003F87B195
MMYLDTSVLVAALIKEEDTDRIQKWLAQQIEGKIIISNWTITEFYSALSIKLRTKQIQIKHRDVAVVAFKEMISKSFKVFSISNTHFSEAAKLVEQHDLGLRAGDALHLAVVLDLDATICTLDRRLAYAADALGAKVESL